MKLITPIFLILVSIGIFFGYVDPTYKKVVEAKKLEAKYDDALTRSKELQQIRDTLLEEYNSFDSESIKRLEKLLPDNIDNVRLIMEIDEVAKSHGLSVKSLSVSGGEEGKSESEQLKSIEAENKDYAAVTLEFAVAADYESFLTFLADLEQSLRLVDITSIDFSTTEGDFEEYKVAIKTYWLK